MKIRKGFVSNSSSSSFVILLDNLEDDQRELLRALIDEHNNNDWCEGWLAEEGRFVLGKLDHHCGGPITKFCEKTMDKKDWAWGD